MVRSLPILLSATLLFPALANAQLNRSAVSIIGLDTNACTVPSPCRTFGKAISQTNSGGEMIALDSGGYGAFTVDRAVTIQGAPGVYAGVTVASGDAVFVNAGASSTVVLRNLVLNGLGLAHAGVSVTGGSAEVHVENCVIQNFTTYGVFAFFNVTVSDTTFRKCGSAIWIDNAGAAVSGTILNVLMKEMDGGDAVSPGTGVFAARNSTVTVRNSVALKATNSGFRAAAGGILNLENCTATDNGTGITADTAVFSLAAGTVRISNNFVVGNSTGLSNTQATIETWGNNKVHGNSTTDVAGALTPVSQN